ncbi:MAG: HEAT repeat domain-containing protein [Planctomycetes bacterium]|nr:HEAT repeat domain-containing protein [Planctomycetota bacterium]MBL7038330.1 HEAT repeat domain-containing protein [Pirellulaceae bacterium]
MRFAILYAAVVFWGSFAVAESDQAVASELGPYQRQVVQQLSLLDSDDASKRAGAAEAIGFLRAYSAEEALIERLGDQSADVRRQAAMALAWCGGRRAVVALLDALEDRDWLTRQATHVSLTNLTGMEFPFDSTAPTSQRAAQARRWREWWTAVPQNCPPEDVLALLQRPKNLARGRSVLASSSYKGPPDLLTDGRIGPQYWQTKDVEYPQWCTIDLGQPTEIARVVVHQYGPTLVMTEYQVATSLDNQDYEIVSHGQSATPVELVIDFAPRVARYVRVVSLRGRLATHPTTFFEIEVYAGSESDETKAASASIEWRVERGLRALGALGGDGATEAIVECLGPEPPTAPHWRPTVRAGIRALGRLREPSGFETLVGLLDNTMWARCAAEALGDFGDARAVAALLAAYPRYAKQFDGTYPPHVPVDDNWGSPPSDVAEDRMLETPFAISYALCRLPLDRDEDRRTLRGLAPLVMANLPGDHDRFMLYELAVPDLLTRHLMEHAGLRQEACEHAFEILGQPRRVAKLADAPEWPKPPGYGAITTELRQAICISTWLPVLCTDREDLPRLVALLEHEEGWVRINAAKTLALLGDERAVAPIARVLAEAKAEADFGYCGTFKFDEYNDVSPRWREAFVRALGLLGAHQHTGLLVRILNDTRSTLGVRYAAAQALADLLARGENSQAVATLADAATEHTFESIRHLARDTFRIRGISPPQTDGTHSSFNRKPEACASRSARLRLAVKRDNSVGNETNAAPGMPEAIVFIKGHNTIPNDVGTVELADRWRRTYVYTDPGPVYRPGRNLHILRLSKPTGEVTPLTTFSDGYVADCELSWDGTHVIFSRRGQDDPWWHVWRIGVDGSGLEQLTDGPHHDVGPAYLPDERIVLSSTRSGIRDEYHGYQCNALYVMNADGSGMERIATNAGRDNEPAVLADGRIAFCRLEMFYARIKTELTLHAVHADGTQDVVLYGPERRRFWHELDYGLRSRIGRVENPLTFGVLRMTQPQAMPDGRQIVVATQAGLALVGGLRDRETIITPENETQAYTTPFPLPDGRVLCAATPKVLEHEKIDLGLYLLDPATQKLELVYNDPATADFEPRPVLPRPAPRRQPTRTEPDAYTGQFVCASVFTTQEKDVVERGRLVRLVEGMPAVGRHSTHTNLWPIWKNHHGLHARVLGTVPLAPDGSFNVQVPADRMVHFQVLDSDRRVIGNQLTWIYPRAGESRSCIGCHERPHTAPGDALPLALGYRPVEFLPNGDEFTYRAKAWMKGYLPPEVEERMRTVRSINLLGRQ